MSLFKVGDKVGSIWGDGVISSCSDIEDATYPVSVLFDNGDSDMFTMDGLRIVKNTHPSIWHKETGIAPVVGERPRNNFQDTLNEIHALIDSLKDVYGDKR